jgi:hypothetical protein
VPSDGICPGACNNSYRRAKAVHDADQAAYEEAVLRHLADSSQPDPERPEAMTIRPWPGEPVFCTRCRGTIHRELAELDDLAALRAAQLPGDNTGGDERQGRVSGTRGTPSPSPAADDIDELGGWLRDWESVVRGTAPRPRRGYLANEVTTITAWLTAHFDSFIVRADIAADFGTETRRWHRELAAKTKAGTGMKHQKRPCPRCKQYSLWLADGANYISCMNEDCNRRLTREEYDALDKAA